MTTNPGAALVPPSGRRPVTRWSWVWAAAPLVTLGFATWAVFLYAAIRRRSAWLGVAAAGYAAVLAVFVIADNPASRGPEAKGIGTVAWLVGMIGGFAHALAIRSQVFSDGEPPADEALQHAEEQAEQRHKLRAEARELAARDPARARELHIGRPDLWRDFDDGGLVDVNHAPSHILATLPGMTAELADKAVQLREQRGSFVSADDLSQALGLDPEGTADLADVTIYPS